MTPDRELPQPAAISLFGRFRAFWHEVDAAKSRVLAAAPGPASRGTALVDRDGAVRGRLLSLLKAEAAEAARLAHGSVPQTYREAHYLMTAMADEVFLRLNWDGASSWLWRPLELEIYGTRYSGELVFDRIDQLTATGDPADRELAAVYLVALALGFEGKYADAGQRAALEEYRRRLRDLISPDRDTLERPLVPECYAHTLTVGRGPLLQNIRGWWWAAAVVASIWLIGSTVAWRQVSAPVADAAARATAAAQGSR